MSWVAAIATAAQVGYGIYQSQKGKRMEEEAGERPDYEIPLAAQQALGTAELRSLRGMPGAVKSQMLQEMDRSRMASLRQVSDRRGGLGAVTQLEQQQQDAIQRMGVMDIEARERNIAALQEQRGIMAGFQERKRADELLSFEQEMQSAAAMKGAGIQNIAGGITSAATMAIPQGGMDSNIFTSKKREAFNQMGGEAGTGQTFKQFKTAPTGGGLSGYDQFIQDNPNFLQQRIVGGNINANTGVGTSGVNPNFAPPKVDASGVGSTAFNTSLMNQQQLSQLAPNIYGNTLQGRLGFNQPFGFNEGMTDNIGLASAMNRQDALSGGPSVYRQMGGLGLNTRNMFNFKTAE
tara:strand:+ start:62 stop:1108 length:1047 start_codon:yes stop_codon:yes gene_type:complete